MITLDGYTMASFGLVVQPGHEHPLAPATVDRTVQIPLRDGLLDFGASLAERRFVIPLAWAQEINRQDLQQRVRAFAAFLIDTKGRPRDIILRYDYEPDKYYTVKLSGDLPIDRILDLGLFKLPLVAYDPYAYGAEQILETSFTASPFEVAITSNGTTETPPVIAVSNQGSTTINGFTITSEILVL